MTDIKKDFRLAFLFSGILLFCSFTKPDKPSSSDSKVKDHPKIVNIINFIRLLEPRDTAVTEDVLYQTTLKQVKLMKNTN